MLDALSVTNLNTSVTIENFSEKVIFVSSIVFFWRGSTSVINIKKEIDPHRTIYITYHAAVGFSVSFLASKDGKIYKDLYPHILQTYDANNKMDCVLNSFSTVDNPELVMRRKFYEHQSEKEIEDPASASVFFTDLSTGRFRSESVDIISSFVILPNSECDSSSYVK